MHRRAARAREEGNVTKLDPIYLWPEGAPDAVGQEEADKPTLTPYLPEAGKESGSAMIVCPGGGYRNLAAHEGEPVAQWLAGMGITAFVLKYRLAPRYGHPAPFLDGKRAIKVVRAHATQYGLGHDRIGILGFSAGGHLASCVATLFDKANPQADDPVEKWSSRPNAVVLVYPVISLEPDFGHMGSCRALLGRFVGKEDEVAAGHGKSGAEPEDPHPSTFENMLKTLREIAIDAGKEDVDTSEGETSPERLPPASLMASLTTYKQVTEETPPTFLVHTTTDAGVPCENSVFFARALRHAGVPVELHLFEEGPHGFGLAPGNPLLSCWPAMCGRWLQLRGFAN